MIPTCEIEYLKACIGEGYCRTCECSDNIRKIVRKLSIVLSWLKAVQEELTNNVNLRNNLARQGRRYNCIFANTTINLLEKIIDNMRTCADECDASSLTARDCPEHLYCDAESIARLYNYFKNPDAIVVTSNVFTLIIEEKVTAKSHSPSDLEEQLTTSFDMLPDDMKRDRCVFIALIPNKGGLPKGFEADRRTRFLKYKGTGALFDPPTLYLHGVQRSLF